VATDGAVRLGGFLERKDMPDHALGRALAGQLKQLRDDLRWIRPARGRRSFGFRRPGRHCRI
jgi:hypothetical protein